MTGNKYFENPYDLPERDSDNKILLDYSLIEDVQVDNIDTRDYPDFVDAFICSATYEGREMTEEELEVLNDDYDYVYEAVINQLY